MFVLGYDSLNTNGFKRFTFNTRQVLSTFKSVSKGVMEEIIAHISMVPVKNQSISRTDFLHAVGNQKVYFI